MEFEGAARDEIGCYEGGIAWVDGQGVLPDIEHIDEAPGEVDRFYQRKPNAKKIEALWCAEPDYSWTYRTGIPHATFEINEADGAPYCRGIVFALADLA